MAERECVRLGDEQAHLDGLSIDELREVILHQSVTIQEAANTIIGAQRRINLKQHGKEKV